MGASKPSLLASLVSTHTECPPIEEIIMRESGTGC
jgi:hypothetical protein